MLRVMILSVVGLLLFASDCERFFPPSSKSEYLQRFENFVASVEADCPKWTMADFARLEAHYQRLSVNWYRLFKAGLSMEERFKIFVLRSRYTACKFRATFAMESSMAGAPMNESKRQLSNGQPLKSVGQ